eukprot:TRINITY_DN30154_c0_g1_i2.p1 TRINITY_DN30154_c0_g1~~TRINITY_DN30154_c0_g1_i2.p1  ORF type:complete len:246 (-),score=20.45 TRINITY_DN30154_c0_g1_i2:12-749(-)
MQPIVHGLCIVLPSGAPRIPLGDATNTTLRFSSSVEPLHYFDWSLVQDCAWSFFVPVETYVDAEALRLRLQCFDASEVKLLGQIYLRHDVRYPVRRGQSLLPPQLVGGLAVSQKALQLYASSVQRACNLADFVERKHYAETQLLVPAYERGVTSVRNSEDFVAGVCLFDAGLPVVEALGHGSEHYVLGSNAFGRAGLRRAISHTSEVKRLGNSGRWLKERLLRFFFLVPFCLGFSLSRCRQRTGV